tara:strand:- start:16095 stop:16433 length:339 start_codon:yes stop_codon:yes gene_type:complete
MNNPKFQLFRSSTNAQYYFRLKASNGETVLASEGYVFKHSCQNGIASVKANAPYDSRYDRRTASNGQYYFVLKASNGEIIGTSEMYTTSSARENGIAAVKRDAPNAPTEDLT